jgi:hypothetical protein
MSISTNHNRSTTTIQVPRRRLLIRGVWLSLALLFIFSSVPRLAIGFERDLVLQPEVQTVLEQAHLPLALPAVVTALLDVAVMVTFTFVALILFWRRGDDWLALLTGMMLISTAFGYTGDRILTGWLFWVSVFGIALMETLQVTFFFIFPDGKMLPRWWRYGVIGFFIFRFVIWFNIYTHNSGQGAVEVGIVVALLLYGIWLQRYRYLHRSTPVQRQQVKWMLIGFTAVVMIVAPSVYLLDIINFQNAPAMYLLLLLVRVIRTVSFFIVPVAIGFAVLRYRLWDIDLTINRSIVAAGVSVVLLIIAAITLLSLQAVLNIFIGQQAFLFALIGAIAAVVLLVQPLRKQIRHWVDLHLYGFRYDLNQLRIAQTPPPIAHPGTLTGKTVACYEVLDLLGRGGMGEVYKAFQAGQLAAIKFLPHELAQNPDSHQRFEREAQLLGRLNHPNVVKLFSYGCEDQQPYMVIEYIAGNDLKAHLRRNEYLTPEDTQALMTQLADALTYVHEQQVIHRDLKPDNVMLRFDGDPENPDVVLMDFGIAKDLAHPQPEEGVIGTIEYMSPEQIMEREIDERVDVYSLGVMCYELLTGELPFKGQPDQIVFAHLFQPAPDPCTIRADIPQPIANAVLRALLKDPEDRFASVEDFVHALCLTSREPDLVMF